MRYLLITYIKRPNGQMDETVELSNRLRLKDLQRSNVILDFTSKRVEQATLDGTTIPKDWDRILGYYQQHYGSIISRLLKENGHAP